MNINCRSNFDKKFRISGCVVDYTKPDIIIATESWLEELKPGKPHLKPQLKTIKCFLMIISGFGIIETKKKAVFYMRSLNYTSLTAK